VSCEIGEGDVGRPLADHEVHRDQALEDDGPCCIMETVLQSSKYLPDASLARMRRDEDVLDVFGLWGCGL